MIANPDLHIIHWTTSQENSDILDECGRSVAYFPIGPQRITMTVQDKSGWLYQLLDVFHFSDKESCIITGITRHTKTQTEIEGVMS